MRKKIIIALQRWLSVLICRQYKIPLTYTSKIRISNKKKNNLANMKKKSSKAVQVTLGVCMSDEELNIDLQSEKYWNLVAEKKRLQLKDALEENERLHKIKESLIEQNVHYKKMLDEANLLLDVYKEVVQDTTDDTGIDVSDLNSSAD